MKEIFVVEEDKIWFSKHIFMFPFKIKPEETKEHIKMEQIVEAWKQDPHWKYMNFPADVPERYKIKTFYYEHALKAMFSFNTENQMDQTVYNFEFVKNSGSYVIKVDPKKDDFYKLKIDAIKLKIYATGIGILSFHLINNEYSLPEDILKISDFGRRIYPQYLPLDIIKGTLLADLLSIDIDGKEFVYENFEDAEKDEVTTPILSKTITKFLGEKIKCEAIIDDRMFTMSTYKNDLVSEAEIKGYTPKEGYAYKNNDFWYRYLFVDGGSNTCQSKEMLPKLLAEHTYDRWIEYGTLYGMSRYSFVMLTTQNCPEHLPATFTDIYYEFVCLILAQRASILAFSERTASMDIAGHDEFKQSHLKETRLLYQEYVHFVNTMCIKEVTAQEQGIELYDMLFKFTNVETESKRLDAQLDELNRLITLNSTEIIGEKISIITYLSGFFAAMAVVLVFYPKESLESPDGSLEWFSVSVVLSIFFMSCVYWAIKKLIK